MERDSQQPSTFEEQEQREERSEAQYGRIFLQWEFPEPHVPQRGLMWYFLSGMLLVILLGYAFFTMNFLFGFIIVFFAVLYFFIQKNPQIYSIKITEEGIVIGKRNYPFSSFKNFWIAYDPPEIKTLYLTLRRAFFPHISVPLQNMNPNEVREVLSQFIEEDLEKEDETILDTLIRILKL